MASILLKPIFQNVSSNVSFVSIRGSFDFTDWGCQSDILPMFAKKCMTMKETGSRGKWGPCTHSLNPPMIIISSIKDKKLQIC